MGAASIDFALLMFHFRAVTVCRNEVMKMAFWTSHFLFIFLSLCRCFSSHFNSTLRECRRFFSQRCYEQQATASATLVKNEEVDGILSALSTNETFGEKQV